MANLKEVKQLISKAVSESAFRTKLLKDPASAAALLGITLSDKQSEAVKKMTAAIKKHAHSMDLIAEGVRGTFIIINPNIKLLPNKKNPAKLPKKPSA